MDSWTGQPLTARPQGQVTSPPQATIAWPSGQPSTPVPQCTVTSPHWDSGKAFAQQTLREGYFPQTLPSTHSPGPTRRRPW